jgi:hypothetical protein
LTSMRSKNTLAAPFEPVTSVTQVLRCHMFPEWSLNVLQMCPECYQNKGRDCTVSFVYKAMRIKIRTVNFVYQAILSQTRTVNFVYQAVLSQTHTVDYLAIPSQIRHKLIRDFEVKLRIESAEKSVRSVAPPRYNFRARSEQAREREVHLAASTGFRRLVADPKIPNPKTLKPQTLHIM